MAILKVGDKETEIVDGVSIIDAAEDLGVPFGCKMGVCGTCISKVLSGKDNLSEPTDHEKKMDLSEDERLACQCTITSGQVELGV